MMRKYRIRSFLDEGDSEISLGCEQNNKMRKEEIWQRKDIRVYKNSLNFSYPLQNNIGLFI